MSTGAMRVRALPRDGAAPVGSAAAPMTAEAEISRWFECEVQPHEPALRAYLQARFPTLGEHDDLVQESYTRLLRERARGEVRHPRAFLFTAARNAAYDLFRRRGAKPTEAVTEAIELTALSEQPGTAEQFDQRLELEVLAEAVRALPERCRQVIMLRYLDNLSYKEIGVQLGISTETVKVHMAKGMRRCAAFFADRGLIEGAPRNSGERGSPA